MKSTCNQPEHSSGIFGNQRESHRYPRLATTRAVTLHCIGLSICRLDTAGHNMAESGALMEVEGRDEYCTLHAHSINNGLGEGDLLTCRRYLLKQSHLTTSSSSAASTGHLRTYKHVLYHHVVHLPTLLLLGVKHGLHSFLHFRLD